jgi:hypothetical protein
MPPRRKGVTAAKSAHSTAVAATPVPTPAPPPVPSSTPATVSPFLPQVAPVKRYNFLSKLAKVPSASSTVPSAPSAPEVSFQYVPHIL